MRSALYPGIERVRKTHKDSMSPHYGEAVSGYEFISQDTSEPVEGGQLAVIVHGPPLPQGDVLDAFRYDYFHLTGLRFGGSNFGLHLGEFWFR